MTRCWNCGLPDVAERCPRCGAPQERRGPGGPPPAAPPNSQSGGLRQPPEFMVNGVPVDPRAPTYSSGPLPPQGTRPPGYPSGPLPPERLPGRTSGPLPPEPRSPDRTSGPLPSNPRAPYPSGPLPPERVPGRTSGPRPPGGGYRQTRPAPEGWDDARALPPEPPRGSGMLPRRGSAPLNDFQPGYEPPNRQRADPPLRPPARPATGPILPARPQGSWNEAAPDAPPYGPPGDRGASRPLPPYDYEEEYRRPPVERAAQAAEPRSRGEALPARPAEKDTVDLPYPAEKAARARAQERAPVASYSIWDEERPEWDEPEFLTLSGMLNALIGATIGGLFGAMIWVGVTFATGVSLPYLTVVVGVLAGLGARFTLAQTRPWSLGIFAVIGALLGFVIAQYGLFDYALASEQARQGVFSSWFPLSPIQFIGVYWDYLINVADAVNSKLGQLGTHPAAFVEMLACMAVCWCLLIRRKR